MIIILLLFLTIFLRKLNKNKWIQLSNELMYKSDSHTNLEIILENNFLSNITGLNTIHRWSTSITNSLSNHNYLGWKA